MPIVNFAGGGKGKTSNKGSSADLMAYLLHEQEERSRSGQTQLFDAQSCLFDATSDMVTLDDAVRKIDYNRKGLKKDEAKFYYSDVNFSEEELASILKGCRTDSEKEAAIRQFIRENYIPTYAANFVGYKNKSGQIINFEADDIVWVAAVHSRRLDRFGKVKDGPGWHAHVVMSRRNKGMTRSLSPTRNHRSENKGSCQGGFDRNAFRKEIERAIEEKYSYCRTSADTISTRVDMAHMSINDLESQVNALMMHSLQLQMEAEERRKAKEKAAQEAAAKKKAEEEARAQAAKEKAALEAAEAKRKAEEQAKAEAEKVAKEKAAKEVETKQKARKPRMSAKEKKAMEERPIERTHHAWKNYYGDGKGFAIFIENKEDNGKTFRTFGRQAELTAQHTDVPIEEFEHSSRKIIKTICLSWDKLREVVGEFVKKQIPYYLLSSWGVQMSDEEQKKVLSPEKKEKTQIPARKPQVEKPQSAPKTSQATTRKPKTTVELAFDAWQREHLKDKPDYPRVVFVLRDGPNGQFYQTYKEDAFSAAWTKEGRQANKMDKGALIGTEYFSTNATNIRRVVSDLSKKGIYCSIIDTNGKKLDLPEPARQQQVTTPTSKPNKPNGSIKIVTWNHQGRFSMSAVIDGRQMPIRQISDEDFKAYKKGELDAKKLIGKYYSSEDLNPPKEDISRGRGRNR